MVDLNVRGCAAGPAGSGFDRHLIEAHFAQPDQTLGS
ncbi:hypothetical protein ABID43_001862 [Methylobacterium goesingense]|uniref:Uncharacterized protein n=1 Tax=Methylobacterium goesingense TaxID=243690 RepID=A0ABV2L6C4_9HYPH